MYQPTFSVYLIFIHCIKISCDNHGDVDTNYSNNNCNSNNGGNRNDNNHGNDDGDGGYDSKANGDAVATDVGISLVVAEAAAAVISMTAVVDRQEQAGSRVTNTNPVENNRCKYFSCIVIHNFLVEHARPALNAYQTLQNDSFFSLCEHKNNGLDFYIKPCFYVFGVKKTQK